MNFEQTTLPISEQRFRELISPTFMVKTRLGTGGPQESEVKKMLESAKTTLVQDQAWLSGKRRTIEERQQELNQLFGRL